MDEPLTAEAGWQDDGSFVPPDVVIDGLRAENKALRQTVDQDVEAMTSAIRMNLNLKDEVVRLHAVIRKAADDVQSMADYLNDRTLTGIADDLRSAVESRALPEGPEGVKEDDAAHS